MKLAKPGRLIQLIEIAEPDGTKSIGAGMVNKQGTVTYGRLQAEHHDGDRTRLVFEPDANIGTPVDDRATGATAHASEAT